MTGDPAASTGRTLDGAVARALGCCYTTLGDYPDDVEHVCPCEGHPHEGSDGISSTILPYSVNPAALVRLLGELHRRGKEVALHLRIDGTYLATTVGYQEHRFAGKGWGSMSNRIDVAAPTSMEALARFVVAAKERGLL